MDTDVFLCQAHIIVANNSLVLFKADLYKEDFERERKDREKARSAEQEMKEGCIRSLQSMSKDLERVTLERNDYRKGLEALESSRSEPDRTVTKQTSSKKSFYWESMKLWSRPRNALVHIKVIYDTSAN